MTVGQPFADLPAVAAHLRSELQNKKTVLLYAYNGTGKTRLSMTFKDLGKQVGAEGEARDTLYFNAFTEDLFHWDNDLDSDSDRRLTLNAGSRFFAGLAELEMDNRIRPLLQRYADFDFRIDTQEWAVRFSRSVNGQIFDNIKVSRGEENIFVWCFFLAIVELAMDAEIEAYHWVKYVYIDDPISSLDEHNAISVANHLGQLLKNPNNKLKTMISSHHTLFFNVMCNEIGKSKKYFLSKQPPGEQVGYVLKETGDTPFFQHVALLAELCEAERSGRLYTYHFNMLRSVLEKAASFHGFSHISTFIKQNGDDADGTLHKRVLDILSHGNYSLYEPRDMQEENKAHFRRILRDFLNSYSFNPELIPPRTGAADTP